MAAARGEGGARARSKGRGKGRRAAMPSCKGVGGWAVPWKTKVAGFSASQLSFSLMYFWQLCRMSGVSCTLPGE